MQRLVRGPLIPRIQVVLDAEVGCLKRHIKPPCHAVSGSVVVASVVSTVNRVITALRCDRAMASVVFSSSGRLSKVSV